MLNTAEVVLNSIAFFLLPLAIYSLLRPQLPPATTSLGRLYHTDPRLLRVGNCFLVAMCLASFGRLGVHFGLIDRGLEDRVELATMVPFGILLVVFLGLLIRAGLRLRRGEGAEARTP